MANFFFFDEESNTDKEMQASDILLYSSNENTVHVSVAYYNESFWLTQKAMAELFSCSTDNISLHLKNIYEEQELEQSSTTESFSVVRKEGNRTVRRPVTFYNLDAIIAVGYRVNSKSATQFRRWATDTLKEYIIKGFVMNDEMLKNGKLFGKDYFDELLARIKEIRASERRFYQKVTDIYATCSYDYNPKSEITNIFFATVQNKLLFAITGSTAPELLTERADSSKPNMGLTTWKGSPESKIHSTDVTVSKNYLEHDELSGLNDIVNMYLDYAENQAKRKVPMAMKDWIKKLDGFLAFNEYDILNNAGKVSRKVADELAKDEFDKFRILQDKEYTSDFDKATQRYLK